MRERQRKKQEKGGEDVNNYESSRDKNMELMGEGIITLRKHEADSKREKKCWLPKIR